MGSAGGLRELLLDHICFQIPSTRRNCMRRPVADAREPRVGPLLITCVKEVRDNAGNHLEAGSGRKS